MYNHIYSIVEDFVKAVEQDKKYSIFLEHWNGKRGPKRRLSITQVISLNLLRFTIHVKDLKAFHRIVKVMDLIPQMPNYENFLKASNKAFPIFTAFLQLLLLQNQLNNESRVHFIDSTPVSTCLNRRIFNHRVTKDFASRGKSTKGWFYGFKLHGVCSEKGSFTSIWLLILPRYRLPAVKISSVWCWLTRCSTSTMSASALRFRIHMISLSAISRRRWRQG